MEKVFVSFDYDNDRRYKFILEAWNNNPKFNFVFEDGTPREINSDNVGRIKAALTSKVKAATHTLVIVGKHSNDPHPDKNLIGFRNWINFEIYQSIKEGNRIAAIKLNRNYESPEELKNARNSWAYNFKEPEIIKALYDAPYQTNYYDL